MRLSFRVIQERPYNGRLQFEEVGTFPEVEDAFRMAEALIERPVHGAGCIQIWIWAGRTMGPSLLCATPGDFARRMLAEARASAAAKVKGCLSELRTEKRQARELRAFYASYAWEDRVRGMLRDVAVREALERHDFKAAHEILTALGVSRKEPATT
jgi:hypothetical protein